MVFTLPAEVAAVALPNPAVVYDLLFQAASATLREVAADAKYRGAGTFTEEDVVEAPGPGGAALAEVAEGKFTRNITYVDRRKGTAPRANSRKHVARGSDECNPYSWHAFSSGAQGGGA